MSKAWFETWFNTKYYHLLYRNRNELEARQFIDALLRFLKAAEGQHFIDVACGKGRHSRYLHSLGYKVTGIDLSLNSIAEAKECSKGQTNIDFIQHDIREPFPVDDLDVAVNLFTSFGYFDTDEEHLAALSNMHTCLRPGGRLVIDYLNTAEVLKSLKRADVCAVDGIVFRVWRLIEDNRIVKTIEVEDGEQRKKFEERVRAFSKDDLLNMLHTCGFEIEAVFGDYQLTPFSEHSPRVVIIAQKKE